MFSVEIWGNVAEVFGALSTGVAAVSAAAYYIIDSRKTRASQARLVRASLYPDHRDRTFEILVVNDSDRPITLELLLSWEKDFAKALLTGQPMETRKPKQIGFTEDGEPIFSSGAVKDAYQSVETKEELLGFGSGGGTLSLRSILGDHRSRLGAGKSDRFLVEYQLYRASAEYRLYFYDASGIAWELELLPASGPPGKLKRSRYRWRAGSLYASSRKRLHPIGYVRVAKRWIGTQIERRLWLHRHRNEKTTAYPMLTSEEWKRLMSARSKRLTENAAEKERDATTE